MHLMIIGKICGLGSIMVAMDLNKRSVPLAFLWVAFLSRLFLSCYLLLVAVLQQFWGNDKFVFWEYLN